MEVSEFLKGRNSRGSLLYIAGITKEVTSGKVVITIVITIAIIVVTKK